MYRGKKMRTKTQGPGLKSRTESKGLCSDLGGYIFDLGPIALDNFSSMMEDLESYFGVDYSNICNPAIMTKTLETLPDPDMSTIVPETAPSVPNKMQR